MGQKIHPIGLRVGIHRKWNQIWFNEKLEAKTMFFHQRNLEYFFKAFFQKFPYTKMSTTKKLLIVDLKFYKQSAKTLYLFIFFYKLRTKRRKNPNFFVQQTTSTNLKNTYLTRTHLLH